MNLNPTKLLTELIAHRGKLRNLVAGKWADSAIHKKLISPVDFTVSLLQYPDTQIDQLPAFVESLASCPTYGLHNPLYNVERYRMLGRVSWNASVILEDEGIADYFARLIQSVMPKSYAQCVGEVAVTREFLRNFSGDQVRFLARGQTFPGDRLGQQTQDHRYPYGPVGIITPFNFPLEIPALQLLGALYMGNRPVIKAATTVAVVLEQFLILLHYCGLPIGDVDMIHCSGKVMNKFLEQVQDTVRLVQFTGSSAVAEDLSILLRGKVRVEDAGFNPKILGPDFDKKFLDYVAWQCDQDAYAASGQKCSAQSILFAHENWVAGGLFQKLETLAGKRNLKDLTIGPVLSWTTDAMIEHISKLEAIPGAKVIFGGNALDGGGKIPSQYGAIAPAAVYVPLKEIVKPENYGLVTTEVFGPVQVVTGWNDVDLPLVLEVCERMTNHLTMAVVSNDPVFVNHVLGRTVNGTTYAGMKARTTGAPQNHWFGPSGDPRAAGIGTPEAIIGVWSGQRGINEDFGPIDGTEVLAQS